MKSSVTLEYDGYSETGYTLVIDGYSEPFGSGDSVERFSGVESFRFVCLVGDFLARKEWRTSEPWCPARPFWYGYKRLGGRVRKVYLGRPQSLTLASMEDAAALLYSRRDSPPGGPWVPYESRELPIG